MAISKDTLEQKINQLDADKDMQSALFDEPAEQPVETDEPKSQAAEDIMLEPAPAPILDPQEQVADDVQVAGVFKNVGMFVAKKFDEAGERLKKAEDAAEKAVLAPAPKEQIFEEGGTFVIREASPEELTDLGEFLDAGYDKGINFLELADNVDEIDLAEYMESVKQANKELFETARRGTIEYDTLLEMAGKQGIEDVTGLFLRRQPGEPVNAETLLAGIIAVKGLGDQTRRLYLAARAMEPGVERQVAFQRALKMHTLYAGMSSSVSAAGSEAARATRAIGLAGQLGVGDLKTIAQQQNAILTSPNAQDIEFLGERFLTLNTDRQRATFAKQSLYARGRDAILEVWINSILTAFPTHFINIMGNASFMTLRTAETALAGGIGAARTSVGIGGKDRVYATEALIQLQTMKNTLINALIASGKTLRTEEPSDLASKIDVRNRRAIGTTGDPMDVIKMVRQGEMVPAFVNLAGMYARLGGRALLAEDEFFKAIGYRASLERLAAVEGRKAFDIAVDAGKTAEEAAEIAKRETKAIIDNPQDYASISDEAQQAAREMTFQGDLDGVMKQLQGFSQIALVKLFIPFFKTPTNITAETLKRSPAMLAYPGWYKRLSAGGRTADEAMAQVTLGSGIGATFAYLAVGGDKVDDPDFFIVGSGPSNYTAQQAMRRQNIQKYSINFKNEDGTYTSIPYRGMEPLSGVLGMAADFANYAQYEEDDGVLMNLSMAMTLGIAQYAMEHPMMDGVHEIARIAQGSADDPAQLVQNLAAMMSQKIGEAGLSTVPTVSSFSASVERYVDPTSRSSKLPAGKSGIPGYTDTDITDLPPYLRGFYSTLAKAKARNPIFSTELPPRYNLYGEPREEGRGYLWEMFNPVRVKSTKYNKVDQEIVRLGDGPTMPRGKIKGIELNRDQYNRWVLLAARMDYEGRMPDDPGYDPTQAMLPVLQSVVSSEEYKELPDDIKIDELKNIVSLRQRAAKAKLYEEDPDLFNKINPPSEPELP